MGAPTSRKKCSLGAMILLTWGCAALIGLLILVQFFVGGIV